MQENIISSESEYAETYIRVASSLATKMQTSAHDRDDLISYAMGEYPNIYKSYDSSRKAKFSTYAYMILKWRFNKYRFGDKKFDTIHEDVPAPEEITHPILDIDLEAIPTLTHREKEILSMRLSSHGNMMSLKYVAYKLGCSIQNIYLIEHRALTKIAKYNRKEDSNE